MRTSSSIALLCALFVSARAATQDLVAIRAGKVHTLTDQGVIENAVVLIENGQITAVGAGLEVPWNAKVIDASDKVLLPTYVLAHTAGGMSGGNERMANVPFLTVEDAVDPSSLFFEEALRNGCGTIHVIPGNETLLGGRGMVLRPVGKTIEDMTVRGETGLKMSLAADGGTGRMAKIRQMRNVLADAVDARDDLARRKAEFDKEKEAGATDKTEFDEELDETKAPIVRLIKGELIGFLYVPSAAEVAEVARLKEQYGLKLVLVLGPQCYKAAAQVKSLDCPVILDENSLEYTEVDPETEAKTIVCPAKILADAGVEFAISVSENLSGPQHYPWWQMATMVRHGMDRSTALRALTVIPAKILGLESQFGTIEPGRVANLQILTADPFKATTWVDTVVIEGEVAYRRADDSRLQMLFGQTAAEGAK